MKKFFALLVAATLIFSAVLPVQGFAQYDKELESVILKAKELFEISNDYDKFQYYMYTREDENTYSLRWNDSKNKLGSISVDITASGKVTGYYKYDSGMEGRGTKLPQVSREKALEAAKEFLKKVNPAVIDELILSENNSQASIYDTSYYFNFYRTKNDIPFYDNNITVSVDNNTGEVVSYYLNWNDNLEFPDISKAITPEEAQKLFKEKLGLKLVYKMSYSGEKNVPYLAYTDVYGQKVIDAITGEVVDESQTLYLRGGMGGAASAENAKQMDDSLTPEEIKAIDEIAGVMTKETAEKEARELLKLDDSYSMTYANLGRDWYSSDKFYWNLNFSKVVKKEQGLGEDYYYASISLDAKNGEIIQFYKSYPYREDDVPVVKFDEAKAKAIALLEKLQPEKFKETEYTDWSNYDYRPLGEELPRQHYLTFTRKVGDAYFIGNGFNVTVDGVTGEIVSYSMNWFEEELAQPEKILSLDEAYQVMFDKIGYELQYRLFSVPKKYDDTKIIPPPAIEYEQVVVAIYDVPGFASVNIDAVTGKLLDGSGKPIPDADEVIYTDIEGHPAEDKILILAEYGISLPGSEFKPAASIRQKEFLYLLVKATQPYRNMDLDDTEEAEEKLYTVFRQTGLIKDEKEANPNAPVTRQEAARFLTRLMGYDKVAEIRGIFRLPFTDSDNVGAEYEGHVAIVSGLGIMVGFEGIFNPAGELTRADAASLIYKYLNTGIN